MVFTIFSISVSGMVSCRGKSESVSYESDMTDSSNGTDEQGTRISSVNEETSSTKGTEETNEDGKSDDTTSDPSTTGNGEDSTKSQVYIQESEAPTEAYVTGTTTRQQVVDSTPIKYGTVSNTVVTTVYNVYSDGREVALNSSSDKKIDSSGYNPSDSDLDGEARSITNGNMDMANEMLRLVNEYRVSKGVPEVELDITLCHAANMRALEIDYAMTFSHTRPYNRSAFTAIYYYGYHPTFAGENLAGGQKTPESAVSAWKGSTTHNELLLNPKVTKMGCGYSYAGVIGYRVWTLEMTN